MSGFSLCGKMLINSSDTFTSKKICTKIQKVSDPHITVRGWLVLDFVLMWWTTYCSAVGYVDEIDQS